LHSLDIISCIIFFCFFGCFLKTTNFAMLDFVILLTERWGLEFHINFEKNVEIRVPLGEICDILACSCAPCTFSLMLGWTNLLTFILTSGSNAPQSLSDIELKSVFLSTWLLCTSVVYYVYVAAELCGEPVICPEVILCLFLCLLFWLFLRLYFFGNWDCYTYYSRCVWGEKTEFDVQCFKFICVYQTVTRLSIGLGYVTLFE